MKGRRRSLVLDPMLDPVLVARWTQRIQTCDGRELALLWDRYQRVLRDREASMTSWTSAFAAIRAILLFIEPRPLLTQRFLEAP